MEFAIRSNFFLFRQREFTFAPGESLERKLLIRWVKGGSEHIRMKGQAEVRLFGCAGMPSDGISEDR